MPASFALSHDGHITAWSADAAASLTRPSEDVLGRHWRALFTEGSLATVRDAMRHASEGKHYSGVVAVLTGDDGRREALLVSSPLRESDGRAGLLCQLTDLEETTWQRGERAFVDALLRGAPLGLGMLDRDLRYVFVNDTLAEVNAMPAKEHVGRSIPDVISVADGGEFEKHLRHVLETGEPMTNVVIASRSKMRGDDRDQVFSASFFRLTDRDGEVLGVGGMTVEVTERETAVLEAGAFRHRLALVNQATSRLGTTLDMDETARELTEFAVPAFVDAVSVEVRREFLDGARFSGVGDEVTTMRLAGRSHLPGTAGNALFTGTGTEHVHRRGSRTHRSLATGRHWRSEHLDEQTLAELAVQENVAGGPERLRETGLDSLIVTPLVARGKALGLVHFARSAHREPLSEEDVQVAEEIAARAALSLDNARLYAEERRVAVTLQQNMLPDEKDLPQRPGLEVACHYRASSTSAKVGGDWFDVIPLSGHRIALVVGDMMGHDIQAAAGMGQMRTAMHTLARLDLEPADLLTRLDKIVEISPAMQYATCVYAVYNTVTRECAIANAGHPAPVLRRADGSTAMVPVTPGVPLGIGLGSSEFSVVNLSLPEDSTLVLYTDGLIERRDRDIDLGIGRMRQVLAAADLATGPVQQVCDDVVGRLTEDDGSDDDLVVLMARAPAAPAHRSARWRIPPEPRSASLARSLVRQELRDWDLQALEDTAVLLADELVTNALAHTRGQIGLQLAKGGTLVVEVTDEDERLPHRARVGPTDDWGRGLALVEAFADDWGARSLPDGKTVWFELPLPAGASR